MKYKQDDGRHTAAVSGPRRITSIRIQGYRPFGDFLTNFGPLEIIVGANASGKSSIFEFLKFLRDSVLQDIPPEIVDGSIGQQLFHRPGPERFGWSVEIDLHEKQPLRYQGEVIGPVGRAHISFERVQTNQLFPGYKRPFLFMDVRERQGQLRHPFGKLVEQKIELRKPTQLALSTVTNPVFVTLYNLREYISQWRFYSSFNIANQDIRKSVPTAQEPLLYENGSNLSAVLFYLWTEHREAFDALQTHLKSAIPGFRRLSVKARGGPGEVIAFWEEEGVEGELSLADLSDGVLRFLCWAIVCVQPNAPTLICIDEPDQGVHPRTLPILAGLFKEASQRTQVLLATHASYFLTQFGVEEIAVMKKVGGESILVKPRDSKSLRANLEEFGVAEIETMHRSDELEVLS
jgi:predicted ATPase